MQLMNLAARTHHILLLLNHGHILDSSRFFFYTSYKIMLNRLDRSYSFCMSFSQSFSNSSELENMMTNDRENDIYFLPAAPASPTPKGMARIARLDKAADLSISIFVTVCL